MDTLRACAASVWFEKGLELLTAEDFTGPEPLANDKLQRPIPGQSIRRNIVSNRDNVQTVIDGIQKGDILGTFDNWYADDVVMSENGMDERMGKAANRAYEEAFVNGVEFHGVELGTVIVDGDHAAIEWAFDLTPKGGQRTVQRQVAVQTWRNGKIVREVFYHG